MAKKMDKKNTTNTDSTNTNAAIINTDSSIKNVLLDTNFFVDMFRFKIGFEDVEDVVGSKCEFWVIEATVGELKKTRAKEAKVALKMIGYSIVKILRIREKAIRKRAASADDAIISLVGQTKKQSKKAKDRPTDFIVATNDAKLRKEIKALGARVIYLRARKHLEIH